MSIQRSSIKKGPAVIIFGSQQIYTAGDIEVVTRIETFRIQTSEFGAVDERIDQVLTEITFTPSGQWKSALLPVLWPYTNPTLGQSLFGAVDTPVVIYPINGEEQISYPAAAITKMPDIILSANKPPIGQMTITCLGKDNTAMTASDKQYTITDPAPAFTDDFNVVNVMTVPYTVSLAGAGSPWDAINTEDGVTVSFNLSTSPVSVDDEGVIDHQLTALDIIVKFKPVGMTLAQVLTKLAIQGAGMARGVSLSGRAANITITGGTGKPEVIVNKVALATAPQAYGATVLRHKELEFVATRQNGTGAMFSVGIAA